MLELNTDYLNGFLSDEDVNPVLDEVCASARSLSEGTCAGSEFTGWRKLSDICEEGLLARIDAAADCIRETSQILVVIGIGGSYLGARASIEFLGGRCYNDFAKVRVLTVGNSLCPESLSDTMRACEGKDISVNVVSKSGTTTEPAIAFRFFKNYMEQRYGKEEAARRIYVTTDREKGALRALAAQEGYTSFVVPDDIGGRFSVLTAVGLLPIAAAGFDIKEILKGALAGEQMYDNASDNLSNRYAAIRNVLYRKGKKMELFSCCDSSLTMFNEWLRQLFGESEGKDGKGIFPESILFSTDMHSLGQYIQNGERTLFETALVFRKPRFDIVIPDSQDDFDNLNYLAGRSLAQVNATAMAATVSAHAAGGVPGMILSADRMDEYHLGLMIYFFEHACAVSALTLGVNPFDQPGVEAYKTSMFRMLGKPGYADIV